MIKIDSKYKEALLSIGASKAYPNFVNFLKIQRNNCMVREFKYLNIDPVQVAMEKRYYQGQVDFVNFLINTIDQLKKKSDNE